MTGISTHPTLKKNYGKVLRDKPLYLFEHNIIFQWEG